MRPARRPAQEEKEDLPKLWFPVAGEGYALGEVLHHDLKSDNMNIRLQLEEGSKVCSAAQSHWLLLGRAT